MQEFSFKMYDDETFCVVGYEGDEANVVIPAVHGSTPVTIIFDDVFKGHSEITSVTIPDTVTNIGAFAFDGCVNLRQIKLPAALEDLWQYAFANCGIEEITLPSKMVSLASFTFQNCKNLKRVNCNPGLKKIHAWAFSGCEALKELYYGNGTQVSPLAFEAHE